MAKAGKYVVHVTGDTPPIYYDNDGRGYAWPNVLTFARAGTQKRKNGTWGSERAVTRGVRGPVIRVYQYGERQWPLYASQVNVLRGSSSLQPREMPDKLIFDGIGDDRARTVAVKKIGNSYRAIPKSEPWRSRFLAKHPSWK